MINHALLVNAFYTKTDKSEIIILHDILSRYIKQFITKKVRLVNFSMNKANM